MSNPTRKNETHARAAVLFLSLALSSSAAAPAQTAPQAAAPTASSFQGSLVQGQVSAQPLALSLDDAIQRGLQTNLGIILSGTQAGTARAEPPPITRMACT